MVAVIYIVLASAMFFLQDTYFLVGGVEFSLKNPCAVGILFLALLNFTVTVRPGRTIVLMRHTVIQVFPYLIPFFFSAIIWVVSGADSITIVNGVGMIVPQILSVLIAAATLYLFGEKGTLYCLGAMCVANFIKVLTVAMEGGIGDFLEEFYQLLVSFSAENGPLMQQLEINDLTFAFGPFLIYLLLWRKKIPHTFLWFFVTLILFLLGLKRIAVPAVALGFVVAIFVRMLPKKAARQAAMCLAAGMIIVSFMYIVGIRMVCFCIWRKNLALIPWGAWRCLRTWSRITISALSIWEKEPGLSGSWIGHPGWNIRCRCGH